MSDDVKFYAVCSKHAEASDLERDIWTVSTNPDQAGWQTDAGFPGYGLTRRMAQFLADAANVAWAAGKRP